MDQQTTQPGYRKSQRAKQPPRRICRGTRENLSISAGDLSINWETKSFATPNNSGEQPTEGEKHHPSRIQLHKQLYWGKLLLEKTESSTTLCLQLCWGTTPSQDLEKEDTTKPGIWTKCLTCWRSCHPWESTEIFLSILSTLWIFTLFKNSKFWKIWFV
jgi:hypothetical protein